MNFRILFFIALASMTAACASTHTGRMGKSLRTADRLPLKVSADTLEDPKNEAFQLIEVTVENTGDQWVKIARARPVLTPGDQTVSMVWGQDLQEWAKAMELREKRDQHNREMLQAGLLVAGTVAAIAGGHRNDAAMATTGAVVAAGTYAWVLGDIIAGGAKNANSAGTGPDEHIAHPFSVPGRNFLRKWILFNKPAGRLISKLTLEFETVEGEKEQYEFKLD